MTRKEQLYEIFEDVEQHRIYCKEQFADAISALPLDEITAIQSHCKINMRIHRDYWLREELPDLVRGEHKGKYFAYKDISDGIRNGFLNLKQTNKMKTPEEILRNKGFIAMVHDESKNILREAFIDPVIQAMQEYAEAYHTAKMQEVTDEDIEKWTKETERQ